MTLLGNHLKVRTITSVQQCYEPKQGVVNEHCQVHGISNLYIAGSSVFPTSGLSNPTLTIIALAVRRRPQERMGYSAEVTKSQFYSPSSMKGKLNN